MFLNWVVSTVAYILFQVYQKLVKSITFLTFVSIFPTMSAKMWEV